MIEVNFGISKDVKDDDNLEQVQDELYEEVEKGIEKYIESLYITSKEFDKKLINLENNNDSIIDEF